MANFSIASGAAVDKMMNSDEHEKKRKELSTFLSCAKGNPDFLVKNCTFASICGSRLDPGSCAPTSKDVRMSIFAELLRLLKKGQQVNGKKNNWSNGCFGSRWCDMDAKKYGVTYIRAAFYSKKFHEGEWKHPTPFFIVITVEKSLLDADGTEWSDESDESDPESAESEESGSESDE